MKTKLFFLAILSLWLFSCKDRDQDANTLPEATQSGANTGGALIDGKVWVAKIEQPGLENGGVNATQYEYSNSEYKMKIVLRQIDNTNNRIVIYISDSTSIVAKTYELSNLNVAGYENEFNVYNTNSTSIGSVILTKFDKTNSIISGKFSFKAKSNSGKIVTITDGRFDKKFINY